MVLDVTCAVFYITFNHQAFYQTFNGRILIAAMNNMDRVINQMLDAPYIAHIYVKDFYSNYTTLSSWLSEMKNLPVTIDEMELVYGGQVLSWYNE